MRDVDTRHSVAEQVRHFGAGAGMDGAWRYERICAGMAHDPFLLSLIDEAPAAQRRPNILLAAVHYLLLCGLDDPLAGQYPTVAAWRGTPVDGPDPAAGDDPFPAFAALCRRHQTRVRALIAARATQTNEIGRCAAILPALSRVHTEVGRPLALVDLGTSAGLNLLFDRYAYEYADGSGSADRAGVDGSQVVLRCTVRGPDRPPTTIPPVVARVGVDRQPVDVRDDDRTRWLLACLWPDHVDRFVAVRSALDVARSDPPTVLTGDVVADLPRAVATLPSDNEAHLCLLHTWVAAYLDPEGQASLARAVAAVAEMRPVSWVFAEQAFEVPALPAPPGAQPAPPGATMLVCSTFAGGRGQPQPVRFGDMHPHGRWLQWYPARATGSVDPGSVGKGSVGPGGVDGRHRSQGRDRSAREVGARSRNPG